jgi:Zn-dependent membrane protease YugP
MLYLFIALLFISIVYAPHLWATQTFKRYARERKDIPGSGSELARHLLERFGMHDVKVEQAQHNTGDHYDPADRAVRLSEENYNCHSLTAITVAAHEVGHAIQHYRNEKMHATRTMLARFTITLQRFGTIFMMVLLVLAGALRVPHLSVIAVLGVVGSFAITTLIHLVTLPVELDASFNKALPILIEGNYIDQKDIPRARRILRAAAFTYVAASLLSIINLWRWIAVLRR